MSEVVAEVAYELARELKRYLYPSECLSQLRLLRNSTEKLVYLYVWLMQPQTFASIRRALNLSKATLARALKRLETDGLIAREGLILYAPFRERFLQSEQTRGPSPLRPGPELKVYKQL